MHVFSCIFNMHYYVVFTILILCALLYSYFRIIIYIGSISYEGRNGCINVITQEQPP